MEIRNPYSETWHLSQRGIGKCGTSASSQVKGCLPLRILSADRLPLLVPLHQQAGRLAEPWCIKGSDQWEWIGTNGCEVSGAGITLPCLRHLVLIPHTVFLFLTQCCGSGSGSARIRIILPDQDPHRSQWIRIRIRIRPFFTPNLEKMFYKWT